MSGSSLKYFAKAKNSVSGIVSDLLGLLDESGKCAAEIQSVDQSILAEDDITLSGKVTEKVKGISDILQRNSMKVVFFGRTSNGKSTVINAMLKDKILPSGIGHTTNCFVQVEGEDGSEAYVSTEDGGKQSVQSLSHLASALSKVKLTPESLIKIHWPKHKCHLLREDVVLVDSPGIDLSADVDEWIEKFCLDADVFVLVANAESTIMQTEKNFFHRVSSRLSKPNIFILNNRWDASASEIDTKKQVRQQHVERCTSFLVDELQVMDPEDVGRRVFFVSALETLQVNNSMAVPHQSLQPSEGLEERIDEFVKFEDCFEDCISKTAVETKFAQHARNVGNVASSLVSAWDEIIAEVNRSKSRSVEDLEASKRLLESIDEDFMCWRELAEGLVAEASQHLRLKMSESLKKELKYLHNVLDEYGQAFDPDDEETMRLYRKDLNFYVEENLIKNLHVSHTPVARAMFLSTCDQMIASACTMLSMPEEEVVRILVPSRNFEVIYNLNCTGLCSEFIEDIEFRFSLGLTALFTRYRGKSAGDAYEVAQVIASRTSSSSSMLPFTSGSTIGMLVLLSAVFRTVGSRVMVVCLSAYALLYIYERLSWTNKMKEQAFKRQYISFVTHQLRTVMDILSSNCSSQIERELNCVVKDLDIMIVKHRELLARKIQESESLVEKLENIGASAASLRSRFYDVSRQLEDFQTEYLKGNS